MSGYSSLQCWSSSSLCLHQYLFFLQAMSWKSMTTWVLFDILSWYFHIPSLAQFHTCLLWWELKLKTRISHLRKWHLSGMYNPCLLTDVNEKLLSALCLCGVCKDESWARWFNLVPVHNHVGPHTHKMRWWHFWSPCILCIQGLGLPQLGATDLLYGKPCKECTTWQIRLLKLLLTFYHLNWCWVRRRICHKETGGIRWQR